ncbi:kelch-like protein 25 [Clavelina lepadiformis]|uniref:kelch-like protein 25 n=1 Tax=Clavelina lepadiformis TaxID=159417 RepID=UPI004042668A
MLSAFLMLTRPDAPRAIKKTIAVNKILNENRKESQSFCDFTIICEDREFRVHKCVLSATSDYFKTLFTSKLPKESQEKAVVTYFNSNTIELILDHVYCDNNVITEENVCEILEAADFLLMSSIKQDCKLVLQAHPTLENCLTNWLVARRYALDEQWFRKQVVKNFNAVLNETEALKLLDFFDFKAYLDLNPSISLNDIEHQKYYKLFLSWVKHDADKRKEHLNNLLQRISLERVSPSCIQKCLGETFLSDVPECCVKKMLEALDSNQTCSSYNLQAVNHLTFLYPNPAKNFANIHGSIYFCINEVLLHYKPLLILKDDVVYFIGGNEGSEKFSFGLDIFSFDVQGSWDLNDHRQNAGCALYRNLIYVAGGLDCDRNTLSSVEWLNTDLNSWKLEASMNLKREGLSLVGHDDKLYAIGGKPWPISATNAVEYFDGETWKFVASMKEERCKFAAVSLASYIYVIGGVTFAKLYFPYKKPLWRFRSLSSVEVYDSFSDTWRYVSSMNKARSGHSACVWKGKIYVVGGGKDDNESVEIYDPVTNKWECA